MLRLHCIFPAILRKQNALPICSLLLVIFKTLQKLTLSSAASAYCLWKQFQSTFCKGKKKSPASKVLQVFALFSSIVLLTKKKGILWNHGGIESPSLAHSFSLLAPKQQLSSSDLSPWRPAGYFGLYFPADCSRFLPHSQALRLLRVAGKGLTVDSLLDPQMDGQESVSCSK